MPELIRFKAVKSLRVKLKQWRTGGLSIGFVPTMGALHEGHLSLVRESTEKTDRTICSIFINPTQFNNPGDLRKYPRLARQDRQLLETTKCDLLFTPSVNQVYPNGLFDVFQLPLHGLSEVLEGNFRPGHFQGVVQVVKRLLEIVEPDQLFMGQKDYQQAVIIGHLIEYTGIHTELIICPTVREKNGLAMSSRNELLCSDTREKASIIYKTLSFAKDKIRKLHPRHIERQALEKLTIHGFKPEYFQIVDGNNFRKVDEVQSHKKIVACTAVWAEDVRLIDNMILCDRQ